VRGRLQSVRDVVAWRLCLGCGACIPACPAGALTLIDIEEDGLRPRGDADRCRHCGSCLQVCPGLSVDKRVLNHQEPSREPSDFRSGAPDSVSVLDTAWGTVREVWEGYAADPEIRFQGSSGGVATALSLFCLERRRMQGVLHIGADAAHPLTNAAVLSTDRDQLLRCTGSRYAPAAPSLGLPSLEPTGRPYVFVGKPCDVAAVRKWQALQRVKDAEPKAEGRAAGPRASNIGLLISIFCAGTPSTRGTRRILDELSVRPDEVVALRYRGQGWPGRTTVITKNGQPRERSMTYEDSWGTILSAHTSFRCRLCPDATGELADLSCGDPWYRTIEPDDPGRSLVLVRTETGRQLLHEAMAAGYVQLDRVGFETLPQSQRFLLEKRRQLWGRLLALRAFRIPVPCYRGFSLFRNWRDLSLAAKVRSVLGTVYRIGKRQWYRPVAARRLGGSN
jgi:coenzyme F420 hydrogenase subunit beta